MLLIREATYEKARRACVLLSRAGTQARHLSWKKTFQFLLLAAILPAAQRGLAQTKHAVISEIYTGATGSGDWVELYNPTSSDIVMTNWTLQYASAAGTSFTSKYIFSGTLPKGGFFLVAGSAYTGSVTADKNSGSILSFANAGGRIALCDANVTLTGTASTQAHIVDFVGYGTAVTYEGGAAAAAPGTSFTIERKAINSSTAATMASGGADALKGNGYDSDNNSTDFIVRTVQDPQNSASAIEAEAYPPVFAAGYPEAASISTNGFSLRSKIDEAGTTYYVVLPQNATAPTPAQVKAGQDAAGTTAAVAGTITHANLDSAYSKAISGLSTGTSYRVYAVAEDSLNNLQSTVTLLPVATTGTPLPVALTAFTATARGGAVALAWHTEGVPASRAFIAERSADGRTFNEVARVAAGAGPQDYTTTDAAPLAGTSYYRLRLLDVDGSEHTSPTRAVRVDGTKPALQVAPNPFRDRLTIRVPEPGCLEAVVYDAQGRTRFSASGTADELSSRLSAAAAGLEPGVYGLQLRVAGAVYRERLIKE